MFLVLPLFFSFQFFLACRINASTYGPAISKKAAQNAKHLMLLLTCSRRKEVILSLSFKSTAPCSAAYDSTTSSNSNGLTVLRGISSSWNWDPWIDRSPTCLDRSLAFTIRQRINVLRTWVLLLLVLNWWPPNFQAALWNNFYRRRSRGWSCNRAHGPKWQVA